jgi:hypothetical protein
MVPADQRGDSVPQSQLPQGSRRSRSQVTTAEAPVQTQALGGGLHGDGRAGTGPARGAAQRVRASAAAPPRGAGGSDRRLRLGMAWTTKHLGGCGLLSLAARAMQHCAEALVVGVASPSGVCRGSVGVAGHPAERGRHHHCRTRRYGSAAHPRSAQWHRRSVPRSLTGASTQQRRGLWSGLRSGSMIAGGMNST